MGLTLGLLKSYSGGMGKLVVTVYADASLVATRLIECDITERVSVYTADALFAGSSRTSSNVVAQQVEVRMKVIRQRNSTAGKIKIFDLTVLQRPPQIPAGVLPAFPTRVADARHKKEATPNRAKTGKAGKKGISAHEWPPGTWNHQLVSRWSSAYVEDDVGGNAAASGMARVHAVILADTHARVTACQVGSFRTDPLVVMTNVRNEMKLRQNGTHVSRRILCLVPATLLAKALPDSSMRETGERGDLLAGRAAATASGLLDPEGHHIVKSNHIGFQLEMCGVPPNGLGSSCEAIDVPITLVQAAPQRLALCVTRVEPRMSLAWLRWFMAHYVQRVSPNSHFFLYTSGFVSNARPENYFSKDEWERLTVVAQPGLSSLEEQSLTLSDCFARCSAGRFAWSFRLDPDEMLVTPPPPYFDRLLENLLLAAPGMHAVEFLVCGIRRIWAPSCEKGRAGNTDWKVCCT